MNNLPQMLAKRLAILALYIEEVKQDPTRTASFLWEEGWRLDPMVGLVFDSDHTYCEGPNRHCRAAILKVARLSGLVLTETKDGFTLTHP